MSNRDMISKAEVLDIYAELYDEFDDAPGIRKILHRVYDKINSLNPQEQKVVKMNRARADIFMGYDVASCPKCSCRWVMHHDQDLNYCPRCGVRVKWE